MVSVFFAEEEAAFSDKEPSFDIVGRPPDSVLPITDSQRKHLEGFVTHGSVGEQLGVDVCIRVGQTVRQ